MLRFVAILGLFVIVAGCAGRPTAVVVEGPPRPDASTPSAGSDGSVLAGIPPGPFPQARHYKVGTPYRALGQRYVPREQFRYRETGVASWYGPNFHGLKTANGEIFDQNALTAAHPTLQMPSLVRVTHLGNGRSVIVRINDRGPFKRNRIIDLSRAAAEQIDMIGSGTAKVRVELLEDESRVLAYAAGKGNPTADGLLEYGADYSRIIGVGGAAPTAPAPRPRPPEPTQHAAIEQAPLDPLSAPESQAAAAGVFVQAGAFSIYDNAARLSANLAPLAATRIAPVTHNGMALYRVQLGPLDSLGEAERLMAELRAAGHADAKLVTE